MGRLLDVVAAIARDIADRLPEGEPRRGVVRPREHHTSEGARVALAIEDERGRGEEAGAVVPPVQATSSTMPAPSIRSRFTLP